MRPRSHDYGDLTWQRRRASVRRRGPPAPGMMGGMDTGCWWCGRPGATVPVAVTFGVHARFADPVLCPVCADGLGFVGGGFAAVDDRRREAQLASRAALRPDGDGCAWCGRSSAERTVRWAGPSGAGTAGLCVPCSELLGFGCPHTPDDLFDDEPCDAVTDIIYDWLARR